jgi:hypothetical protein
MISFEDVTSDQESIGSEVIKGNRLSISSSSPTSSSSNDTREEIFFNDLPQESNEKSKTDNNTEVIILKPTLEQGIKRKLVDYDDSESEIESEKNEEPSQVIQPISAQKISTNDADLPIALRRSRRNRKAFIADSSADSSSTNTSASQVRTIFFF